MEQADAMRAEIYLLLASLFRQAPNQQQLQFLADLDVEPNSGAMGQAWLNIAKTARETSIDTVEDEYQTLFIGIGRGEVVPFASWHITGSLMEKPLAELRQHMAELGLIRSDEVKEPEDHIAALCESMAWLVTDAPDQQQNFFYRHIEPWFNKLVNQIKQAEHAGFYLAVAELVAVFFHLEKTQMTPPNPTSKKNTHKMQVKNLAE